MTRTERLARTEEVDRYADWLAENDPRYYLDYHRTRTQALDWLAGPIRPGETLEVHVGEHKYKVIVECAL